MKGGVGAGWGMGVGGIDEEAISQEGWPLTKWGGVATHWGGGWGHGAAMHEESAGAVMKGRGAWWGGGACIHT